MTVIDSLSESLRQLFFLASAIDRSLANLQFSLHGLSLSQTRSPPLTPAEPLPWGPAGMSPPGVLSLAPDRKTAPNSLWFYGTLFSPYPLGVQSDQLQSRWAARDEQKTQEQQSSAEVRPTLGERIETPALWMEVNK